MYIKHAGSDSVCLDQRDQMLKHDWSMKKYNWSQEMVVLLTLLIIHIVYTYWNSSRSILMWDVLLYMCCFYWLIYKPLSASGLAG